MTIMTPENSAKFHLLCERACQVYISVNDHKSFGQTIFERLSSLEETPEGCENWKMLYSFHVYPLNTVGFFTFHGETFDQCLNQIDNEFLESFIGSKYLELKSKLEKKLDLLREEPGILEIFIYDVTVYFVVDGIDVDRDLRIVELMSGNPVTPYKLIPFKDRRFIPANAKMI